MHSPHLDRLSAPCAPDSGAAVGATPSGGKHFYRNLLPHTHTHTHTHHTTYSTHIYHTHAYVVYLHVYTQHTQTTHPCPIHTAPHIHTHRTHSTYVHHTPNTHTSHTHSPQTHTHQRLFQLRRRKTCPGDSLHFLLEQEEGRYLQSSSQSPDGAKCLGEIIYFSRNGGQK